jgi:hypothetical protein
MPDADELITIPASETLGAVLLRAVLLGYAQSFERLIGLHHSSSALGSSGEA